MPWILRGSAALRGLALAVDSDNGQGAAAVRGGRGRGRDELQAVERAAELCGGEGEGGVVAECRITRSEGGCWLSEEPPAAPLGAHSAHWVVSRRVRRGGSKRGEGGTGGASLVGCECGCVGVWV